MAQMRVSQFTVRRPAHSCPHRCVLASMAREVSVLLTPVCVSVQAALGVSTQAHSMPSEKTCPEHARKLFTQKELADRGGLGSPSGGVRRSGALPTCWPGDTTSSQ